MFIWTFLLRITHTIISRSLADSSWITLYAKGLIYKMSLNRWHQFEDLQHTIDNRYIKDRCKHLPPYSKYSTTCVMLDIYNMSSRANFISVNIIPLHSLVGAHSGAVGWGTMLQAQRYQVQFPMVSEFFIDLILLAALWPRGQLSLWQKWVPGIFPVGLKAAGACANCVEIWGPQPPGKLRACPGLHRDCSTINFTYIKIKENLYHNMPAHNTKLKEWCKLKWVYGQNKTPVCWINQN